MNGSVKVFIMLVLAGIFLSGCSTTRLVSSWHDPSVTAGGVGKPLVIALANENVLRQKIEDEYVRQLAELGVDAEQSYRIFPDEKQIVPETVKAKLPELGRNSVLVTHFVDVRTETVYVPPSVDRFPTGRWYFGGHQRPTYYDRFDSYYNRSYSTVRSPGYTYNYKVYVVETNLYAASEKLLWTAITESDESNPLDSAIRDFVRVIAGNLKKSGSFANSQ